MHAGGIDQPLEIVRMDTWQPFVGVPHANWRGTYDVVTMTGSRYTACGPQIGYELGTQAECFPFHLASVNAFGDVNPKNPDSTDQGPRSWAGSLITGSRDASGLLYRRNRYLDPKSGRFTQEDPIGLAGGLNAYGFANGDPISLRDPFGLSADSVKYLDSEIQALVDELRAADQGFDAAMRTLENDEKFMYVFEKGPLVDSPGMIWDKPVTSQNRYRPGDVETGLPIVSLMFDWSHMQRINQGLEQSGLPGGPITRQMVVGHEVWSHALPFSLSGGSYSCPEADGCGIQRHNELGARLGWPERRGW